MDGYTREEGIAEGRISDELSGLIERQSARVFNLALRMTRDRAIAEELTQETFLRAWRGLSSFSARSSLSTWIYAIAKNVCRDHLRGKARGSFSTLERLIDEARAHPVWEPHSHFEREYYVQAVKEGCLLGTLHCLPFSQRLAFLLASLCGLDARTTGLVLGRSENAARILVHRATKKLKAFLCRNCSRYAEGNRCRCENLVGFSIARGWIAPPGARGESGSSPPQRIADEIGELQRVIALYRSLPEHQAGDAFAKRVRAYIETSEGVLFAEKSEMIPSVPRPTP